MPIDPIPDHHPDQHCDHHGEHHGDRRDSPRDHEPQPDLTAVRRARAYLLRAAEPPAPALCAYTTDQGPLRAAHAVRTRTAPAPVLAETTARHETVLVDQDTADAATVGARLVIPEDDEWPHQLHGLCLAIWAQSTRPLREMFTNAVTITGARATTPYGEHVATDLAHHLAHTGMTIVSGLAYGIDGAAHRGALTADGLTAAVLPNGIDIHYPAGHNNLQQRIRERGAVLSEYPPGTAPARHRFPARARLLAALSRGTLIVEAGARSGSHATAGAAAALGRPVMAVPGPITSATSAGCHALLATGTVVLVTSPADVHTALRPTQPTAPAQKATSGHTRP